MERRQQVKNWLSNEYRKFDFPQSHESMSKNDEDDSQMTPTPPSSEDLSPDGLYFKSNDRLDADTEDRLSSTYKQTIEQQAREVTEEAEKKPIYEIFEFDDNPALNENVPGANMTFLDRLFHQLTRRPPSESEYYSDDVFTPANDRQIRTVTNEQINRNSAGGGGGSRVDISSDRGVRSSATNSDYETRSDSSFMESLRAFVDDLGEETDVIRGVLDEDALIRRRSRRQPSVDSSANTNQLTAF